MRICELYARRVNELESQWIRVEKLRKILYKMQMNTMVKSKNDPGGEDKSNCNGS